MLLRIDVYPYNAKIEEVDEDGIPVSPIPPLYACLGTSKPDGELFTVGRKDSSVILSDKSVSRRHLTVSLVSTHESIEDRETVPPKTTEEVQACENDPNGECIIVKDSSKFGTFLVKEGSAARKTPTKDATDGSDTEDESQPQGAAEGLTLSPVTAMLTNSKATLERMKANSSVVLPPPTDRVMIQCGQNGSTILIRRVPFNLLWSRLDKSTRDLWNKRLHALGASSLHTADETMTHLVTNERMSNAKHLVGWYMNKPPVTTEYLQALWDRRSPTDPMPKESDCEPTMGKEATFWKKKPNTKLYAGITFLNLLDDDFGSLCGAAGATVVTLHDITEKEAVERLKKMDLTHAFYVGTNIHKVAKIVKYLKKHDVSHVTQKAVGQSVAKMIQLEDHKGDLIGPPLSRVQEEEVIPPPPEDDDEEDLPTVVPLSKEKKQEVAQSRLPPIETIPEESRETSEQSMEQMGDVEESVEGAPAKKTSARKKRSKESSQEPETTSARKKRSKDSSQEPTEEEPPKQRRKMTFEEPEEETPADTSSRKKSSKDRSQEPAEERPPKQRRKKSKEPEEDAFADTGSRKKRSKESTQEQPSEDELPTQRRKMSKETEPVEEKSREEANEAEWNAGDEPKKLEVSDGWFVAAPSGKRRKAYLRPIEDDSGEEPPPPTAGTETSSKLVVGPRKASHRAQSKGRRGGKNFKKFRKNSILKGSVSRIQLRSVLPKESEAEKALDERERALEEEQRLADALFGGAGSGIRSHFQPKKRKR